MSRSRIITFSVHFDTNVSSIKVNMTERTHEADEELTLQYLIQQPFSDPHDNDELHYKLENSSNCSLTNNINLWQ